MQNFWNNRYAEEGFSYGKEANDFLKANISRFPAQSKILCLAEGEGRNAIFLAQKGFHVTAVDFSEVGMKKASQWARELNLSLETMTANLATFELGEGVWDGIISIFGHLPSEIRTPLHQRIIRALKPKGIFLMEAYTPDQLQLGTGGPKDLSLFMTSAIIKQDFSELETICLEEKKRCIEEGKYHNGESAVVQFIGRKT
jgi:SAM-dependent methyltransferase